MNKKEMLGLLIIPCEYILVLALSKLEMFQSNETLKVFLSVGIFFLGFLMAIYIFKDFLKKQWKEYRKKLWKNLAINIVLVVGIYLILIASRLILPKVTPTESLGEATVYTYSILILGFVGSIQPFIAPFVEELVFRYLLFGKINNKVVKGIMFVISSILFGLIHINNFNGNWILTIPYMLVGVYLASIYYFTKNIWNSIIVHWIFNSISSIIPATLLIIAKLIGII